MFLAVLCCTLLAVAAPQPAYPEQDLPEDELVEISEDDAPGILMLDPLAPERNMLHGVYLIDGEESDLQLELLAQIQGNEIVSITTFHKESEDVSLKLTSLSIPLKDLHHRKISNMRKRILEAAREAVEVFQAQAEHFPSLMDVETTYQEMADALFKATDDLELDRSQLRFILMYHSCIVGSARRISEGATEPDNICAIDPKYTYGTGLFICTQDLFDILGVPPESTDLIERNPDKEQDDDETPEGGTRQKREYHPCCPPFRWPPSGRHWGCCSNYGGRCWFASIVCWYHDCLCQCCGRWYCGWRCRRDSHCGSGRIRCT